MDIKAAQNRFRVVYFLWAKEWLRRESVQGYPILRSLKETQATTYLAFLNQFPEPVRILHANCLQERAHIAAMQMLGQDKLTGCEDVIAAYRQFALENEYFLNEKPRFRAAKKSFLKRYIIKEFAKIPALKIDKVGGGELRFIAKSKDVLVVTTVYTGSSMFDLSYFHSIKLSAAEVIAENLSVLSWCGVSSQTQWTSIAENRAAVVAYQIGTLVDIFLKEVHTLLENSSLQY